MPCENISYTAIKFFQIKYQEVCKQLPLEMFLIRPRKTLISAVREHENESNFNEKTLRKITAIPPPVE